MSSITKICRLLECVRTDVKGYGYCSMHYQRFKKHGDPNLTLLIRHGLDTNAPEYKSWVEMRRRCYVSTRKE